ncbi:hypothetical protein DFR56_107219 [Pseudogracilibacillus auburnensis]|uniref:Uncharacterized protein n=1 Tax=Pseudogracilibacillus auburnensis TaxID=1494959 RepID=A0A2V3VXH3_9BACI|nr:hypothetical protein DFR56_107219 [Pseudogracilibacillus auburnensis]
MLFFIQTGDIQNELCFSKLPQLVDHRSLFLKRHPIQQLVHEKLCTVFGAIINKENIRQICCSCFRIFSYLDEEDRDAFGFKKKGGIFYVDKNS